MAQRNIANFKSTKDSRYADSSTVSILESTHRDMWEDAADSAAFLSDANTFAQNQTVSDGNNYREIIQKRTVGEDIFEIIVTVRNPGRGIPSIIAEKNGVEVSRVEFDGVNVKINTPSGTFIIPSKTTTQRNALTPEAAMILYNSTTGEYEGYGTNWKSFVRENRTEQTLTDGATVTFDAATSVNAKVTLGDNRTLAFSNVSAGQTLILRVIQDGTGSRTLALPATCKVINGGAGAVTLSTDAGAEDILTFYTPDGTNFYVTYGLNFT